MGRTILVTGSSGTVGTALTLELMRQGFDVIPLDVKHSLWDKELNRRTVYHDLREPIGRLRKKPDMIVHLAAHARVHELVRRPDRARDNYIMTANLLEYARKQGVERFLFASSREVYGESRAGERRKEDSTVLEKIKSPYTASKFGSEALLRAYEECYGLKTVTVRLSNVYGRYDISERVVPLFTFLAYRDRDIPIYGREKKLDFTYIDDCVDGLMRIIRRFDQVKGLTFNISRGVGESLIDLAHMIVAHLGSRSKVKMGNKRAGEISTFVGDITLARSRLGYSPQVSLKEGIPGSVDWLVTATQPMRVYQRQRRNLIRLGYSGPDVR